VSAADHQGELSGSASRELEAADGRRLPQAVTLGVIGRAGGQAQQPGEPRPSRRPYQGRMLTAILVLLVLALAVLSGAAQADGRLITIDEILGSWQGDDEIQFVELRTRASGQNLMAGAELEIFGGDAIQHLRFPAPLPNDLADTHILIATERLANLAGLDPDFTIQPGILQSRNGRICYRAPDPFAGGTSRVDCVAYGDFSGDNDEFGAPTPITPDNRSLQRVQLLRNNRADFRGVLDPTPENSLGQRAVLRTTCVNDGLIDSGEECDGTNLRGKTCATEGFEGRGTLRCLQCHIDTSECTDCGNEALDKGEDCDGQRLDGRTCTRLGFTQGTLACAADCTFDTAACEELQIPGGSQRADCFLEWSVANPGASLRNGRPPARQRCVDGDPTCDFDGGTTGFCTFHIRLCFNRDDVRLGRCRSSRIGIFDLRRPSAASADRFDRANAAQLLAAVSAIGVATEEGGRVTFSPPLEAVDVCSDVFEVVVPLRERPGKRVRRGKKVLKTVVTQAPRRRRDRDKIKLQCIPGLGGNP
jgi:hypothetical protein